MGFQVWTIKQLTNVTRSSSYFARHYTLLKVPEVSMMSRRPTKDMATTEISQMDSAEPPNSTDSVNVTAMSTIDCLEVLKVVQKTMNDLEQQSVEQQTEIKERDTEIKNMTVDIDTVDASKGYRCYYQL